MASKTFHLAPGLDLPEEAVTQTIALLARRGAGKTHTASVLAEEMLAGGYPIIVLDPTGVWWGLRSGYPVVILGGEHADVPLEPGGGKVVASFVVNERVPVILDVSGFGEGEMRRFVADFATEFYRTNRKAIHWFIDEADEFAPQQQLSGPAAKSLGALQNIVRRGRARGIGVTLITQRSAVINKSLLTQTECLIALQTTGPQDLKAIDDWIQFHGTKDERNEILASLPKLERGEAWVYSPGWLKILKRVKIRARRTHDSSATPKPGEHRAAPKTLKQVDLKGLTQQLADTIERAKADDPVLLRKRIGELEQQIKAAQSKSGKPAADPAAIETARAQGYQQGVKATESRYRNAMKRAEELVAASGRLKEAIAELPDIVTSFAAPPARPIVVNDSLNPYRPRRPEAGNNGKLSKPEAAILLACYWLRNETPSKAKVSFYSNYSATSSSFSNALGSLRTAGLLTGFAITQQGVEAVGDAADKPRGPELHRWLRQKLTKAENAILDALIAAHPQRLSNAAISASSGYSETSSSFNNALGALRTIDAAEGYDRDGGTKAADVFFE